MVTKRLVLLSDTHLGERIQLPDKLLAAIDDSDLILHAGDFTSRAVYEYLRERKEMVAALGNTDDLSLGSVLPEFATTQVLGHPIAVVHGWGPPSGLVDRIVERYDPSAYEMVVFGHSHYPEITGRGGTLFVNPGSPLERRFAPYNSFAIVDVTPEEIGAPEIIRL